MTIPLFFEYQSSLLAALYIRVEINKPELKSSAGTFDFSQYLINITDM